MRRLSLAFGLALVASLFVSVLSARAPQRADSSVIESIRAAHGIDRAHAAYLSLTKTEVREQSPTSLRFVITFPDRSVFDHRLTLTTDQSYRPTTAEQSRRLRVFGARLGVTNSEGRPVARLSYFVPYSAMPAEVREGLQKTVAWWRHLGMPVLFAQAGETGANVTWDTAVSVGQDAIGAGAGSLADAGKISGHIPVGLDALFSGLEVWDAWSGKRADYQQWSGSANALEDCAKNPTNPLAAKASPEERAKSIATAQEAQSELKQLSAARFMGQLTGVAAGLVKSMPLATMLTPALSWNDDALKQLSEQRLREASNAVTPCAPKPPRSTESKLGPMRVEWTYTYVQSTNSCGGQKPAAPNISCMQREERKGARGSVGLEPEGQLGLKGIGQGSYIYTTTSTLASPPEDTRFPYALGGTTTREAQLVINAGAASTPSGGVVEIRSEYSSMTQALNQATHMGDGKVKQTSTNSTLPAGPGPTCRFTAVDLTNGGSYSIFTEGGYGTCRIEIHPER